MKIEKIAEKYGTDKLEHGYMPFYEKHLPKNPVKLLEIGCLNGASMRVWRTLFPNCELHTLDLFEMNKEPGDIPGLICHKGSQSDLQILGKITDKFDVVIDDGSHNSIDQLISFNYIFTNNLPQDGLYVIEDLHCCNEKYYRHEIAFEDTLLGQMKSGKFPHRFRLYLDKIAFVWKQ